MATAQGPQRYEEYFVYGYNRVLTAGNGSAFIDDQIRIDSDSDFKLIGITYVATDLRIMIRLQDDSLGRYLTKNATDLQAIGGYPIPLIGPNTFLPYKFPSPFILSGSSYLNISLSDYSGAANTTRIAFHGVKVKSGIAPWELHYKAVVPVIYNFRTTIAANSTITSIVQIDKDAHFKLQQISGYRSGSCLISVNEGGTGRDWSNIAVHFDNIIGNSQFPNRLFSPRFIHRGSAVTVNLQDLSGAANTVEVNLAGLKMYE